MAIEKGIELSSSNGKALLESLKNDENEMVPYADYAIFYEYVLHKSGDKVLGLHDGERYNMAALGVVGQLVQASRTIREAIQYSCSYFNLISSVLKVQLRETEEAFQLLFDLEPNALKTFPLATEQFVISAMVFTTRELFFLTLKQYRPIAVKTQIAPVYPMEYQRVFGVEVQFESDEYAITFSKDVLDEPIVMANYELMVTLENVICSRLKPIEKKSEEVADLVRQLVYKLLDPQIPDFKTIAQNMNQSTRNLQRKLKAEGTSYSVITTDIKKELVLDYLKKDLSIKEISFLMGYSGPSAFVSAFKKWYGVTPVAYRTSN